MTGIDYFPMLIFSSIHDNEDDGIVEFRQCIRTLADKVGILSRQRAELFDRSSKFEAGNKLLMKELEEKKELVKTLYTKHQIDKQVNKLFSTFLWCVLFSYDWYSLVAPPINCL